MSQTYLSDDDDGPPPLEEEMFRNSPLQPPADSGYLMKKMDKFLSSTIFSKSSQGDNTNQV